MWIKLDDERVDRKPLTNREREYDDPAMAP